MSNSEGLLFLIRRPESEERIPFSPESFRSLVGARLRATPRSDPRFAGSHGLRRLGCSFAFTELCRNLGIVSAVSCADLDGDDLLLLWRDLRSFRLLLPLRGSRALGEKASGKGRMAQRMR